MSKRNVLLSEMVSVFNYGKCLFVSISVAKMNTGLVYKSSNRIIVKDEATDIRCFARIKFSRSLVQKKNFACYDKSSLIENTFFVKEVGIPLMNLNELSGTSGTTIVFVNFVNRP